MFRTTGPLQGLLAAFALSSVGTAVTRTALPLVALATTDSVVLAGTVLGLVELITLLSRVVAGALVDRLPLRRVLLLADAVRTGTAGLLALSLHFDWQPLWALLVLPAVTAALSALFEPAALRAVHGSVVPQQAPRALAANEARASVCDVAGPPLAGLLFALTAAAPFAFDALTYVASFVILRRLRLASPVRCVTPPENLRRSVRAGLQFLSTEPLLRLVLAYAAVAQFIVATMTTTLVLTERQQGASATALGLFFAAGAAGGALGAATSRHWAIRLQLDRFVIGFTVLLAALLSIFAVVPLPVSAALLALMQFIAVPLNGRLISTILETTPVPLHGRVIGASLLTAGVATPVAPLLAGTAVAVGAATPLLLALATATAVVAAALLPDRRRKQLQGPASTHDSWHPAG